MNHLYTANLAMLETISQLPEKRKLALIKLKKYFEKINK